MNNAWYVTEQRENEVDPEMLGQADFEKTPSGGNMTARIILTMSLTPSKRPVFGVVEGWVLTWL
jgi:hypothetical protein